MTAAPPVPDHLPPLPRGPLPGIGCVGAGFIMADCHLVAYAEAGIRPVAITSRRPEAAAAVAAGHGIPRVHATLDGQSFIIIRQAGEMGQLYGSVATRDIAEQLAAQGHTINRNQIVLNAPIKTLGLHKVPVHLHAEIDVSVTVNVARSPEEAERQARGESATIREEINLDDLGLEVGAALNEAGGSLGD